MGDYMCMHCDKANYEKWKYDVFKCDKPCREAKQKKRDFENFINSIPSTKEMLGIR